MSPSQTLAPADTSPELSTSAEPGPGADPLHLDIRVFEGGSGLDEIIRMTDDGCGATCETACTSC